MESVATCWSGLKHFCQIGYRPQVVNILGCLSDSVHITSGVPQGSVLGPTLFLLFIDINDIEDILFGTSVRMKLFADDVNYTVLLLITRMIFKMSVIDSQFGLKSGNFK